MLVPSQLHPGLLLWRSWCRQLKMSPTWRWRTRSWWTGISSSNPQSSLKAGESFRSYSYRLPRCLWTRRFLLGRSTFPSVSLKFGAQSERNDAQNLLGMFGSSAERGSTNIRTRHQTCGGDQRGKAAVGGPGHVDCSSSLAFFHLWSDVGIQLLSSLEFRFCFPLYYVAGMATPDHEGRIGAGFCVLPGRNREAELQMKV